VGGCAEIKQMSGLSETFTAWLNSFGPVPPFAVRIPTAQKVLGDKSRSTIYEAVGRGELVAVKDGAKTLITVESIKGYCAAMPPAQIKPPTPRKKAWPSRRLKAPGNDKTVNIKKARQTRPRKAEAS
jgi:hypothetical protein